MTWWFVRPDADGEPTELSNLALMRCTPISRKRRDCSGVESYKG